MNEAHWWLREDDRRRLRAIIDWPETAGVSDYLALAQNILAALTLPDGTTAAKVLEYAARICRSEANSAAWKQASGGSDYQPHIDRCMTTARALLSLLPEEGDDGE